MLCSDGGNFVANYIKCKKRVPDIRQIGRKPIKRLSINRNTNYNSV